MIYSTNKAQQKRKQRMKNNITYRSRKMETRAMATEHDIISNKPHTHNARILKNE